MALAKGPGKFNVSMKFLLCPKKDVKEAARTEECPINKTNSPLTMCLIL
jgi:hypothetical protein